MKTLCSCYCSESIWPEKGYFPHLKLSVCAGGRVEEEGRKLGERKGGEIGRRGRRKGGEREKKYINV